jgi:hypothetical protein
MNDTQSRTITKLKKVDVKIISIAINNSSGNNHNNPAPEAENMLQSSIPLCYGQMFKIPELAHFDGIGHLITLGVDVVRPKRAHLHRVTNRRPDNASDSTDKIALVYVRTRACSL